MGSWNIQNDGAGNMIRENQGQRPVKKVRTIFSMSDE
jgi:hypothetical protein